LLHRIAIVNVYADLQQCQMWKILEREIWNVSLPISFQTGTANDKLLMQMIRKCHDVYLLVIIFAKAIKELHFCKKGGNHFDKSETFSKKN